MTKDIKESWSSIHKRLFPKTNWKEQKSKLEEEAEEFREAKRLVDKKYEIVDCAVCVIGMWTNAKNLGQFLESFYELCDWVEEVNIRYGWTQRKMIKLISDRFVKLEKRVWNKIKGKGYKHVGKKI